MKILHVISSVDPGGGGPIEGVKQLSTVAKLQGHDVEIASLDGPKASFLKSFPHLVHPLGPGKFKYGYSASFVRWLRTNAGRFDAVVINGIWQYHSFAVWRALKHSSTPYVVFTHGMLAPWFRRTYPLKHLKKWLYWPWAEYRVLRDAAAVFFTSEEERAQAKKSFWLYKANEVVTGYGVASPQGSAEGQTEQLFIRFPELRGKRLALFMGRIHPIKGCDLILKAFAEVLAGDAVWHLVLAGPDQVGWQTELISLANRLNIAERITWTGMLSGDLKWGALHGCEVLLLPSHHENFGMVVVEALACGTPTLISDQVNIWRAIQAGGAGLVAQDSLEGTSSLLRTWLQMSDEGKALMRTSAQSCFKSHFEIHGAGNRHLEMLSAVRQSRSSCAAPFHQVETCTPVISSKTI